MWTCLQTVLFFQHEGMGSDAVIFGLPLLHIALIVGAILVSCTLTMCYAYFGMRSLAADEAAAAAGDAFAGSDVAAERAEADRDAGHGGASGPGPSATIRGGGPDAASEAVLRQRRAAAPSAQ